MRDDLHKSVPPRTLWAKVLRLVGNDASKEDLRDAITLAIRRDANWITSSAWGRAFEQALDLGNSDFFAQEKVREQLIALLATCPNPHARSTYEIAMGLLAREDQMPTDFKNLVLGTAMRNFGEDCLELLSSRVAAQCGAQQSTVVRRRLHSELPNCDLLRDPPRRGRKVKLSVDAALDLPLSVSL